MGTVIQSHLPQKTLIYICALPVSSTRPDPTPLSSTLRSEPNQHVKEVDSSTGIEHHLGYVTYIHIWMKHMRAGKGCIPLGWQRHTARVLHWAVRGGLPPSSASASGSICHSLQPPGVRGCHPSSAGVLSASVVRCGREPQGGNRPCGTHGKPLFPLLLLRFMVQRMAPASRPEFCKALFDFTEGSIQITC